MLYTIISGTTIVVLVSIMISLFKKNLKYPKLVNDLKISLDNEKAINRTLVTRLNEERQLCTEFFKTIESQRLTIANFVDKDLAETNEASSEITTAPESHDVTKPKRTYNKKNKD
jgi:hypothetical protein